MQVLLLAAVAPTNAMTNDNQFVLNTHSPTTITKTGAHSLYELSPIYKSAYKTRNSFINSQAQRT